MTYRGRIKNGVVVLDAGARLPEGTEVRVETIEPKSQDRSSDGQSPLFRAAERAKATGVPDLAINHDHYLYGHAKVSNGG